MRLVLIGALVWLAACGSPPPPPKPQQPPPDATKEGWYAPAVEQLAAMNRDAERLLKAGSRREAAAIIGKGAAVSERILSASKPTLAAMEAASDRDQLYGRMLLEEGQVGWARLQFQKNAARWKSWRPQTGETARRFKLAQAGIAECDLRLGGR